MPPSPCSNDQLEDEDDSIDFEELRRRNIAQNEKLMTSLGFRGGVDKILGLGKKDRSVRFIISF